MAWEASFWAWADFGGIGRRWRRVGRVRGAPWVCCCSVWVSREAWVILIGQGLLLGGGGGGIGRAGGFGVGFGLGEMVSLVGEVTLLVGEGVGFGGGLAGNILLGVVVGGGGTGGILCGLGGLDELVGGLGELLLGGIAIALADGIFHRVGGFRRRLGPEAFGGGVLGELLGLLLDRVGELLGFLIGRLGGAIELGFVILNLLGQLPGLTLQVGGIADGLGGLVGSFFAGAGGIVGSCFCMASSLRWRLDRVGRRAIFWSCWAWGEFVVLQVFDDGVECGGLGRFGGGFVQGGEAACWAK